MICEHHTNRTRQNYWVTHNGKVRYTPFTTSQAFVYVVDFLVFVVFANALCIDEEVVTKLAELDMMVSDLERANSRVVTVERRNVSTSRITFSFSITLSGTSSCRNRSYQEW